MEYDYLKRPEIPDGISHGHSSEAISTSHYVSILLFMFAIVCICHAHLLHCCSDGPSAERVRPQGAALSPSTANRTTIP